MSGPHIQRSLVLVPAFDRDVILEMADFGPDAMCLDFEDLTPASLKCEAREVFGQVIDTLNRRQICVMVRTNSLSSGQVEADLEATVGRGVHCVNLPKIDDPDEVVAYERLVAAAETASGMAVGETLLRPIIETARGVKLAYEIALSSERIAYMGGVSGAWAGDLATSLGYRPTASGVESLYLRSKVLTDVRAAGVACPIGGGAIGSQDLEALRPYYEECRALGYTGVHCPRREDVITLVNELFLPTQEEIAEWRRILPALEEAEALGWSSVRVDERHYDVVCLERIRPQLELVGRVAQRAPGHRPEER